MKLYKCARYPYSDAGKDEWMGALLIFADNPEEAISIFREFDRGRTPEQVIEIKMAKGIAYDDFMR